MNSFRNSWFFNVRADVLAGITVALALIPEAISFAIIAGVDPMVGLYASFCIAVVIAFVGGRPGMISAATGAMALLMVDLVKQYGLDYLLAATILTGIIQFLFGILKIGRFITFVPQSVVTGFVNALAIMIFMAQLPHFVGATWQMYALVAGTLAIIYILPRFTKSVPSPLIAIIVMTIITVAAGIDVKTVGDMGEITRSLPFFHIPQIEWSFSTLLILLPYSLPLALVGIMESLMTATIIDEFTDTKSDKNQEVRGQGIANFVTGFFGGMAGCAMIGQSVINVKSGGRGRLSTFVAGVFLLFLIIVLGGVVQRIPMAALVGVMMMVSIGTFDWRSIKELPKTPLGDGLIMIVTVAVVVATDNLAIGVILGVILSALRFGWKMAKLKTSTREEDGVKIYTVSGQLFFGSASHFLECFDYPADPEQVIIDFAHSHIWDHSAVTAIEKVVEKYKEQAKTVSIAGLNEESKALLNRVGLSVSSER
ncbi:SulP family inorganic anion transporter [Brevibacillus fulvus]|uniref:SulP family sulfate permease n=1 Tax=Brevibacillus fulvus TaxID=1125967 RepID=A0A938Y3R4_9BACL|nr:SulP family inorganic anion transporter [Brevibacillus fulvus]MBM7591411.1 SulP family sulfate permease [Brevibacillus fulvus]